MLAKIQTGYRFGPFRLCPEQRLLVAYGRPVAIKGRAFDLLSVLVLHRDRVLSRDEIFALVWAGTTVADNNLTVQISSLRRTLQAHGGDPAAIANVPGRGYRFVGKVEEDHSASEADPAKSSAIDTALPVRPRRAGHAPDGGRHGARPWRLAAILAVLTTAAILVALVLFSKGEPNVEDNRLTIALESIEPDTPALSDLARQYTDAIQEHPSYFGDVRLFTPDAAATRYCLTGRLEIADDDARLHVSLWRRSDKRVVFSQPLAVPRRPSPTDLKKTARAVLMMIRPDLFQKELDAQNGTARDALDWYVRAQVATEGRDDPTNTEIGIADLERARENDPDHKPSVLLLALLLTARMSFSPATAGQADGWRARSLLQTILTKDPRNAIALQYDAIAAVLLNRPGEAIDAATKALQYDPGSNATRSILVEALIEQSDFRRAREQLALVDEDYKDGSLDAQLAFAAGRDELVEPAVRKFQLAENVDLLRNLMELLVIAAKQRGGAHLEAKAALAEVLPRLPPEFRHVAALRQTYYDVPARSWPDFKALLRAAGMPADARTARFMRERSVPRELLWASLVIALLGTLVILRTRKSPDLGILQNTRGDH